MKVALLGPVAWRTPPRHYGPWELITSLIAEGLVARGVEVTLFATADSVTAAALDGPCPHGYAEDETLDGRVYEALHVSHAFGRSAEFDLVHNHLDWLPLAFSRHCRAPLLTTIHGFSNPRILPAYQAANSGYVSISDADRVPELDYAATIHHG
ncbi:MAG TPA: glycosyltransferase, partial [Propionibacteriaceae bacterium]|nr:glycosyltransferase [Propionibacteriaceae bacterium]